MRFAYVLVVLCSVASVTRASAQDDRLPVVRPQVETVKASPAPFPFADKTPSDYDTWIRTPWIQMNRAKCGQGCMLISLITNAGLVKIDHTSAKNGLAKLRLGVTIPASCGDYLWYGEMKDDVAVGAGIKDPAEQPIERTRIHLFRFDERGREISMVFQNEHTERPRQARLNVLCKAK